MVHALRWTSGLAALAAARDLQVPGGAVVRPARRHRAPPRAGPGRAGTERIRLEPAIGRTVNAVVASSYDEETDLTRLGVPRRSIRVVPAGDRHRRVHPEAPPCERGAGAAW